MISAILTVVLAFAAFIGVGALMMALAEIMAGARSDSGPDHAQAGVPFDAYDHRRIRK
jgi:hypothetical protein